MPSINLLYKKSYAINDYINIVIPTVGEILDSEDQYYGLVSMLTAMPIDLMVQLDEAGIDFETIDEYDLFLILFDGIKSIDTSLVFGDLDLSKFKRGINKQNQNDILFDEESGMVIDRIIHNKIAGVLREIHHIKKNYRKPANKEAKDYMLERAKKKLKRHKHETESSWIESLIISVVNNAEYKYNFETTRNLTIYQFNESVRQVMKKVDFDNKMHGIYSGTISAKHFKSDELTWLAKI